MFLFKREHSTCALEQGQEELVLSICGGRGEKKQGGLTACNCIPSHVCVLLLLFVCVPLTIHKSLQALHQGFDRAGQVPGVLLDILVNDTTAADGPVFCLTELCLHETEEECVSVQQLYLTAA